MREETIDKGMQICARSFETLAPLVLEHVHHQVAIARISEKSPSDGDSDAKGDDAKASGNTCVVCLDGSEYEDLCALDCTECCKPGATEKHIHAKCLAKHIACVSSALVLVCNASSFHFEHNLLVWGLCFCTVLYVGTRAYFSGEY
jgi:hypothetical protein